VSEAILKTNPFLRATAAKIVLVVAATIYFTTPSQAFFWGWHHHHHHFKHKVVAAKPAPASQGGKTSVWVNYVAISGLCATASLGIQAAIAGPKPLSLSAAHGSAAGCFLPFIGQWLIVEHYKRLCTLSRNNPAFREYRIYCAA
jgi:hypothetical protein